MAGVRVSPPCGLACWDAGGSAEEPRLSYPLHFNSHSQLLHVLEGQINNCCVLSGDERHTDVNIWPK